MGMSWAEHTVEIEAPIETSFAAIVDYESFPRWQGAVDSVEVIDRTEDGLGRDVRLFVDAKVKKIDYVLRYSYDRPTEIRWDFVEGNGMRDVDGVYTLEQLGPERTRATYNLGADPEIPVPGIILRRTHRQLVKGSVEDLKTEAERRHAAGEDAEPAPAAASPALEGADAEDESARPIDSEGAERSDDWVPKAAREAPPRLSADEPPGPRPSGPESLAELPVALLGKAVSTGREVGEGAMRAGISVAESAVGVGREAADGLINRVSRKLGAGRDDER